MDTVMTELMKQGVLGLLLVFSLVCNVHLVKRLFVVIENNTKALTMFTDTFNSFVKK